MEIADIELRVFIHIIIVIRYGGNDTLLSKHIQCFRDILTIMFVVSLALVVSISKYQIIERTTHVT